MGDRAWGIGAVGRVEAGHGNGGSGGGGGGGGGGGDNGMKMNGFPPPTFL